MTVQPDRRRQLVAWVVILAVIGLVAGGIVWANRAEPESSVAASAPSVDAPAAAPVTTVLLVAVDDEQPAFTPPVGEGEDVTRLETESPTGLAEVDGGAVGLYGGTEEIGSCDKAKLAGFLAGNADKAAAWAEVQGIDVGKADEYIDSLTPVVLRADTLVTNHGFFDGEATPFAAILQAGTAVLVDDRGSPVVRCACGNPLASAPAVGPESKVEGTPWRGWNPRGVIQIKPAGSRLADLTLATPNGRRMFTRPIGTIGAADNRTDVPVPEGIPAVVVPGFESDPGPAVAAPPAGDRPEGDPIVLFEVGSLAGVSSGPTADTVVTFDQPAYLTSFMTYHYLNGGALPGTVALRGADGTVYGPWPAVGSEGQGGVANAYWTASPNTVIPAGTYTVVDSDPATWSWALDTDGRGITIISGFWMPDEATGA
jgi:hypothetical protein